MTIDKTYQPAAVEGRIYAAWEAAGAFRAGRPERAKAAPYCIVIPPPNVTGSLHMGHALNNTLQDILCRFERMRGKDVLWQPGTDHAGIATQAVVERQLMERQEPSSREMGREAFIKRVWEWKAESGGAIIGQLKRLGASCDWSRERFTMGDRGDPNDQMVRAVMKAFVNLYNTKGPDGRRLIYKDKRLVNWDTKLQTAISDLEVQQVETNGHLWYIRYPIEGSNQTIIVATTRPETMLGDVAVAVHPKNEHLKDLIGKIAILPLVGRRIPIIADEYADPEKGTGAVKVTPAHDFNDFEVGKRHALPMISVLDREARLRTEGLFREYNYAEYYKANRPDLVTTSFAFRPIQELEGLNGASRSDARKEIVRLLEREALMEKVEPHVHTVPYGDRSNEVIEPLLSDQWYVDAKTLAQPAIGAVRSGKTVFEPKNWEKTYFDWMEHIQPWCISRQIWWGHRIPCWYGFKLIGGSQLTTSENELFVAETEQDAVKLAEAHYRTPVVVLRGDADVIPWIEKFQKEEPLEVHPILRDPDVLDTWFSSALWPFSTLGWPDLGTENLTPFGTFLVLKFRKLRKRVWRLLGPWTPNFFIPKQPLERFYPNSILVTGFDIIFFWVARMMMMGLHFMKEVPFPTVYIHALVRDERGQKMSKSKGNVIDPLEVIDEYGADALRFTLAAMAAQGRDIKLSSERVAGYRNFATKLWNAARFAEVNECRTVSGFDPSAVKGLINQWIVTQLADALGKIEIALDGYRFNDAANAAYHFVWNLYCDWYLELAKQVFVGVDEEAKRETRATVAYVRDEILKILQPFMPFVTEELWQVTESTRKEPMLALATWPAQHPYFMNAQEEVSWLIDLVSSIRSVRTEMNVPAGTIVRLALIKPSTTLFERARRWDDALNRLARVDTTNREEVPRGAVQMIVGTDTVALELQGVIDLVLERARLAKEMAKCDADIARVEQKLGNADFLKRAPEDVVEGEREKRDAAQMRKAKIAEALERLKGAA